MNSVRRVVPGGLKTALGIAAWALTAGAPVSRAQQKPSFDVISIKASPPLGTGTISIGAARRGIASR